MSSDEYKIQNIHRYSRKSYNKIQPTSTMHGNDVTSNPREDTNTAELLQSSPQIGFTVAPPSPGCSWDFDSEAEITNILHKKCPVILLAQQQLLKLLEETNKIVAENTGQWSSLYHLLCFCKQLAIWRNACQCVLIALVFLGFFCGLVMGAATCGVHSRKFNNPLLNCIDNYFVSDHYISIEDTYRSIT